MATSKTGHDSTVYLGDALWVTMDEKGTVCIFKDGKQGYAMSMTSITVRALHNYCQREHAKRLVAGEKST